MPPGRVAVRAVVERAQDAHAGWVRIGFHHCVAGSGPGNFHRRIARDATGETRGPLHFPISTAIRLDQVDDADAVRGKLGTHTFRCHGWRPAGHACCPNARNRRTGRNACRRCAHHKCAAAPLRSSRWRDFSAVQTTVHRPKPPSRGRYSLGARSPRRSRATC